MAGDAVTRLAHWLRWTLAAVVVLSAAADVASKLGLRIVWDDAYMYARYADHLLGGLGLRWNPGEPPTFGLTALLFVLPVTLLRALGPASDDFAVLYSSFACGILMVTLLAWLALRLTRAAQNRSLVLLAVLFGTLAGGGPTFHFTTGMDTTLVLAVLAALLVAAPSMAHAPTRRFAAAFGAACGGLFLVRPDLLLFPAGALAALAFLASDPTTRSRARLAGLVAAGVLAAELAATRGYFGSALPLPFYAKASRGYGPAMDVEYARLAASELAAFARNYWLLIALAVAPLVAGRRRLRDAWGPLELGLLASTAAFCVGYRFFVLQVMPYGERFYQPMVPPLVWLACRGGAALLRDPPFSLTPGRRRVAVTLAGLSFVAGIAATLRFGVARFVELTAQLAAPPGAGPFDGQLLTADVLRSAIFAVEELPDLPDDLVVAGTEIGFVGLRARRKRVVDLCGLHDTDFALHGFSAERLMRVDRPDLLYLPHRDYVDMRKAIRGHPVFLAEYELFTRQKVRGFGLALRRTGPHYARLREMLTPWLLQGTPPRKDDADK